MTLILSGTNGVSDIDGDASTPAVRGTDANSGIFFGADTVGISAGGTQKLSIGTGSATIDGLTVGQGAGSVSTNTAFGKNALAANTTGSLNTAVGDNSLAVNTTGANNTAVGYGALDANTTGRRNTAVGLNALGDNTTGDENSAFGHESIKSNTTGTGLAAFGYQSLFNNTTAQNNSAFGYNALVLNTTGGNNTALGYATLLANTTGANNTAVGYQALTANTTGASNTAVGYQAGVSVTTGGTNVFIGTSAGSNTTTGFSNTYIGNGTQGSAVGNNNEIVIGNSATGKGSATGFIYPNGGGVYQGNNSSSWSTTSDQRLKKNIVDNTEGLDKINAIQVRNFEYRTADEVTELPAHCVIDKTGVQLGVIAQELQQVCPDCVKEESTGVLSVDSDNVFWHMVNAIKELSAQVTALQAEVNTLKGQ